MDIIRGLIVRLRSLFGARAADLDLDDEIRYHLERETEKNVRLGLSPDEARRRALADFGGVRRVKEEHRDARGVTFAEEVVGDARFALRTLKRSPAIAGAAIITLALGIGANAAIFSAVNAVILRPLPFNEPDRLYALGENNVEKNWHMETAAPANMLDWKERVPAFQDIAAYESFNNRMTLTGMGEPQRLNTVGVTGNFFSLLGARPLLGRGFTDAETWRTGERIAVLTYRGWRDHFGSDPSIVGKFVQLEGTTTQIVGVMPPGFAFPNEDLDAWRPTGWNPQNRAQIFFRRAHWMRPIVRLKPGVTAQQANVQFQQIVERLKVEYPQTNKVMGAGMVPLHDFLVGDTRLPLLVLLGAVALLLLIACANVGNLLLVQAAGRERELSVRVALGAGRQRIVRQALTESLVLSFIGGVAGLAVGWAGTRALVSLQPQGMLRVRDFGMDWSVFAYVLALTTVSGILFGIAPAIAGGRRMPADALRDGGKTSQGRRMRRWGDALVVGEVALSLMLTIGAGLLVRSFWQLRNVDPGFDPRGVITVPIDLPDARYDSASKVFSFYDRLRERVHALPGVTDVALTSPLPLNGTGYTSDFTIASHPKGEYGTEVAHRRITPGYFKTMRVPLLQGRDFTDADTRSSMPVVIINEALARKHFKGENPIGQRIVSDRTPDSNSVWQTIVGVAGSEHMAALSIDPKIEIIEPVTQDGTTSMTLVARTTGDPAALGPAIRRVVAELDDKLALGAMLPMQAVYTDSLGRERFLTTLLLVFAGVGLVLAVVGVYGVIAQHARRRSREMGIRIALGAQEHLVRWMIVRQGLGLTIAGLLVGGSGALLATRAMQKMLFHTPPTDPVTFASVAVILIATGLVASWLPARKASRADPIQVLRGE